MMGYKNLCKAAASMALCTGSVFFAGMSGAAAAEIKFALGSVGNELTMFRAQADEFEKETGHKVSFVTLPQSTTDRFQQISLWLAQGNKDIDLYMVDVIWAPQIANHLVSLNDKVAESSKEHFASVIGSQTVDGNIVAMPLFTDAPALYYRKDLLEKYSMTPPKTWDELTSTAKAIMMKEREAGNSRMFGFVFQGKAYEGLTCDALEWVYSNGGGRIIEDDGSITINNPQAAAIIDQAASWVGDIAPKGVTTYTEEEARGVWQEGNSVFMRNWPYAYSLSNDPKSKIAGKFDVVPLPAGTGDKARSAATLGGWNIAVSKYSEDKEAATAFLLFLVTKKAQKERAIQYSYLPTVKSLYDDPEVQKNVPHLIRWKDIFVNSVARPSAPTKKNYNKVSTIFFKEVNAVLIGDQDGKKAVENIEKKIKRAMR